ncbi:MAG: NDP-sugar synthase [Anaerolineae bacterium]|nr:NDP-sugar synthase [Anaerolineae bacterium]
MKIIIPLTRKNTPLSKIASDRPEPLLSLAGNTIFGHLLLLLKPTAADTVIIVTGQHENTIKSWMESNFPEINAVFVNFETAGRSKSILACRDHLDDGDILVVSGRSLSEVDYVNIPDTAADVVVMTQPDQPDADANVWWFRNGRSLLAAIQATTGYNDALKHLRNQGAVIVRKPVKQWLDARTPDTLLQANQRLLALGRGFTEDAIDRSYAEDFTVMPPVYVAENAYVESGVVGPYTHIGAGVTIKNAIISNSIIEDNAKIENCILNGSIVGENTHITGRTQKLFVGDNSTVQLS